jgi:hypothetical protein
VSENKSNEVQSEMIDIEEATVSQPNYFMNGPEPFIHPVTGKRIGPYEYYEGNAHQEHENVEEAQPKGKKKLTKEGE